MIFKIDDEKYIDTTKGIDISIPLSDDDKNPRAWYVDKPIFEPVRTENFIGSVAEGGGVNFRNIYFNPHGHGTHTECLGHITKEVHSINRHLKDYFFNALLITVQPEKKWNETYQCEDEVITFQQIASALGHNNCEALIIRTLPNEQSKKEHNYSGENHAYIEIEAAKLFQESNIKHLLIDLPSVDREKDEGKLAFHHAFWQVPENPQFDKTITELIYVDNLIPDGKYILNLQTAPFENDASPSRPILFEILEEC